jgi:hypothetical protein
MLDQSRGSNVLDEFGRANDIDNNADVSFPFLAVRIQVSIASLINLEVIFQITIAISVLGERGN